MRCRRSVVAVVVVLGGLALAGCERMAAGSPTPATTLPDPGETSGSAPSTESEDLAPPIENPKDLRGVDPCQLLTPQQVADLTFTEPGTPGPGEVSGDPGCTWVNSNLNINLQVNTDGDGIEQAYRGAWDNSEKSTVGDYPALRVNFSASYCGLFVGVADDQVLSVSFGRVTGDDPAYEDSCAFAESLASMALENMPAG